MATVLRAVRDLPSYIVAPVFTFLGGALTLFFGPRIQWSIEKKRELRQHRRQLIAQWQAMVSDVSKELDRLEQVGTSYHPGDILRMLERHAAYASFTTSYNHYSRARIRLVRSWLRQKLVSLRRKPRFSVTPEQILSSSSRLPTRLRVTLQQITQIESRWKLHK
jgi:hypothetical protein